MDAVSEADQEVSYVVGLVRGKLVLGLPVGAFEFRRHKGSSFHVIIGYVVSVCGFKGYLVTSKLQSMGMPSCPSLIASRLVPTPGIRVSLPYTVGLGLILPTPQTMLRITYTYR